MTPHEFLVIVLESVAIQCLLGSLLLELAISLWNKRKFSWREAMILWLGSFAIRVILK